MGSVYKRGKIWWMKIYHNGQCIRKSTKKKDRRAALKVMRKKEFQLKDTFFPRVLIFDIETSPMEVYVWHFFQRFIPPMESLKKDWAVLTWSAKWLFDDEIMSDRVSIKEAMQRKDKSVIKSLWDLFEKADILVGHNCDNFDVRRANLRFLVNGLGPPMPYRTIDTKKESKKVFAASSYKLDYLNRQLGLDRKIETKFELWDRCVSGDEKALFEMEDYNRHDITATEELYMIIRPWIKSHPNMSLYVESDGKICQVCQSEKIKWKGFYYTPAGKYKAFRCRNCGAIGRSRYTSMSLEWRRNTNLSVAR